MNRKISNLFGGLAISFLVVALTGGCQTFRHLEYQASQLTFSSQMESELGTEFAEQIEEEIVVIDDPFINQWITNIGNKLVQHSPPSPQSFTFKVTADRSINAFAIPGGYCYVNAGLILAAENEAQVVAVVGHEINHVTRRHGMVSLQRAVGLDLLASSLTRDPSGAAAVQIVTQAGGVVAMRTFSREDEREADRLGVEAMYKAGYDPREAASFFEILHRMEQQAGRDRTGAASFLSNLTASHPTSRERIENIRAQVAQYPNLDGLIRDTPDFPRVQQRLREILANTTTNNQPAE